MNKALLSVAGCLFSLTVFAQPLTLVVNSPAGPVADVIVYADSVEPQADLPMRSDTLEIAQKNKAFAPYISVVQRQAAVNFVNRDDITHHIYSLADKNRFAFKLSAGSSQKVATQLDDGARLEVVAMGCNIHDWMSGYLLVLDTPYFAKTDAQGRVTLDLQVDGQYRVGVWHPQLQAPGNRQEIVIDSASQAQLALNLNEPLAEIPEQRGEDDFEFLEEY